MALVGRVEVQLAIMPSAVTTEAIPEKRSMYQHDRCIQFFTEGMLQARMRAGELNGSRRRRD
jgi:hypothetical protein